VKNYKLRNKNLILDIEKTCISARCLENRTQQNIFKPLECNQIFRNPPFPHVCHTNISCLHVNVCHASKNFAAVEDMINSVNYAFDFVILTETGLFNILNYNTFNYSRSNKKSDGILIYIKNCYNVTEI
jgi:hypothetical protein